jgi:hypothetical protein
MEQIRLCSHPLFAPETKPFQLVMAILFARLFAANGIIPPSNLFAPPCEQDLTAIAFRDGRMQR